jgi:hypothetical protein
MKRFVRSIKEEIDGGFVGLAAAEVRESYRQYRRRDRKRENVLTRRHLRGGDLKLFCALLKEVGVETDGKRVIIKTSASPMDIHKRLAAMTTKEIDAQFDGLLQRGYREPMTGEEFAIWNEAINRQFNRWLADYPPFEQQHEVHDMETWTVRQMKEPRKTRP